MMKTGYKSIVFPAILAALAITLIVAAGCEDPGSYGDTKPVVYGRVVVYQSATEPPMDDPRADIWAETVAGGIWVSDSAFPTSPTDTTFDILAVQLEAIKTTEHLYLRAQWFDHPLYTKRSYDPWEKPAMSGYSILYTIDTLVIPPDTTFDTTDADTTVFWSRPSLKLQISGSSIDTMWLEQDRFAIIWDAGLNGEEERSDCHSMCHAVGDTSINGDRMFTAGGGLVDVWHWQLGMTDPVLLAQDEYWDADGRHADPAVQEIYSNNYDPITLRPIYTNSDSTKFFQKFLHADDTVSFDTSRHWANSVMIPAHIVHDNAAGSIADVDCYSSFNMMDRSWMLLMRRSLTTDDPADIDFGALESRDSVLVTIAVMNHDSDRHFCSRPFYIVFP